MERVYNFSAGPSMLPVPVLEQAQRELLNYSGAGCSVMEMSHRSRSFEDILNRAEASLRRIMRIGPEYSVLFLQGGASLQFSMVPMNLGSRGDSFDYVLTGQFAQKAFEEAARWGNAVAVASSADQNFTYIPSIESDVLTPGAKYLHITVNNTIFGTTFHELPLICGSDVTLVGDMSSVITGEVFDVSRFGLIYAGAQKNMGPAGLTVVIIRNDLLDRELDPVVPTMLSYPVMAKTKSMYNTPPCFAIYIAGLVYEWVEKMGGVAEMERINREKAGLLYDAIDNSSLFNNPVQIGDRSIMNVVFTLPDAQMTNDFLKMTKDRGIINIKGHRAVGGFRASIYNAMPRDGVLKLVECMKEFERQQH
jgi:phosphoserine aminotransferase